MAYDDYNDDPRTPDEMVESTRRSLADLEDRLKKLTELTEDSAAGIRMEITQSRRELLEVRSTLGRLQTRFDNQLLALALANIASGVGVAALVLGAAHAF